MIILVETSFWSEANNQYGFIKVTVSDEAGQFLYGVETFKRSLGSECEFNFLASDGQGGYRILKRWNFDGTTTGDINPFSVAKGWSDLKRNDGKVQVFIKDHTLLLSFQRSRVKSP